MQAIQGDYHLVQYLSTHWTCSDLTVFQVSHSESPMTSPAAGHVTKLILCQVCICILCELTNFTCSGMSPPPMPI